MVKTHTADSNTYGLALIGALLGGVSFFLSTLIIFMLFQRDERPNFDAMSWSLSVLQTLLAVAAIAGFWMIRGAAILQAKETAEAEAQKVSKQEAESVARRTAEAAANVYFSEYGDTVIASYLQKNGYIPTTAAPGRSDNPEQQLANSLDTKSMGEE